ncbi:hypothetical protein [uncultured Algimonas sp.]|uniref:hypothetical protein n=1 Tax=uncultured Algimonas sp. TaxID=1547920 RepID=UPI002633C5F8|nr:hypothetical protein [uncultured Algimonas sp.]
MQFEFENAFLHFARTGAPRGFVWRYALAYLLVTLLFGGVMALLFGGWYVDMFSAVASDDPQAVIETTQMSGSMMALIYLVVLPLSLLFYAVFEAAYLRRYMRRDRFRLRLGADEWRVFVVLLIWMVAFIASTIVIAIAIALAVLFVGIAMGSLESETGPPTAFMLIGTLSYIAVFVGLGALAVRFSPAAALTIRDRRVRFFEAWRATKGKFWTLFGAYAAWLALAMVAYIVVMAVFMVILMPVMGGMESVEAPDMSFPPALLALMALLYLAMLVASALFYYVWAGPAALAAKTYAPGLEDGTKAIASELS